VWGSEFTTKPLHYREPEEFVPRLNGKFGYLPAWCWRVHRPPPPSKVLRFQVAAEFRRTDPTKMWSLSRSAAWWAAREKCVPSPQACRHKFAPGRAAGCPRRGFVPQAQALGENAVIVSREPCTGLPSPPIPQLLIAQHHLRFSIVFGATFCYFVIITSPHTRQRRSGVGDGVEREEVRQVSSNKAYSSRAQSAV
jgi:hypothetical protein